MSIDHLKKVIKRLLMIFPLYRKVSFQEKLLMTNFNSLINSINLINSNILGIDKKIEFILNDINSDRNLLEELHNLTKNESYAIDQLLSLSKNINNKLKQIECVNPELLPLKMHDFDSVKYKILICGYYGAPNMGDEAMLYVLLKKLKAYKQLDITVMYCYNKYYNFKQWIGINFIHYPRSLVDFETLAKYYDCIIFGGGALLDDDLIDDPDMDFENVPNILLALSESAMAYKKQLVLLGLSTNTILNNTNFIKKIADIANYASHFSVRDQLSLKSLASAGLDIRQIDLINDIAFSINPLSKKLKTQNKILGIVLMSTFDNNKNLDIINSAIDFIKAHSHETWSISFIPFYMYENFDLAFYNLLAKEIDFMGVPFSIADSTRNVSSMQYAIAQCDLMICMRYHASLFSFKQGIPAVHVIFDDHAHYPNKMLSLAETFYEKNMFIPFSEVSREKLLTLLNRKYDTYITKESALMDIANEKHRNSNNELDAIIETNIVQNAMRLSHLQRQKAQIGVANLLCLSNHLRFSGSIHKRVHSSLT